MVTKRSILILAGICIVSLLVVVVAYRLGVRLLRDEVVAALGPGSRVAELKINWFTVELLGLSIDAPKGWPTAQSFEAERVIVTPDLRSLFSRKFRIFSIAVERPYLSILRSRGKLSFVPSLTDPERRARAQQENGREVIIARIELREGSVDFYDATVSRPPLKTRIEQLDALIEDVAVPAAEKTSFEIAGIVKGIKRDGLAKATGWVGPGAHNSSSRVVLENVDLVALQPYLLKKTTRGCREALST